MRKAVLVLVAGVVAVAARGEAFHEKGVANCNGCHVTHPGGGGEGTLVGPSADAGLLIAESPSDVCLVCHAENLGSVLGSDPLAPPPERGAGNFVFLLEDNLNDAPAGATHPVPGDAAGHNLVAPGHGLRADPRHVVAPGGTFPASRLGCTSCHDPHGNASFRMLYGAGPVMGGEYTFTRPAPEAEGLDLRSPPERDGRHSAYRRGISDWCGNCHGASHEGASASSFEHSTDRALGGRVSQRYNRYDGDDHPTDGVETRAYLADVPFEDTGGAPTSTRGPDPGSRVMCLTCHRAHASSAPSAGRWDFGVALLVDDGRVSGSHPIPNPYRSPSQGPLCSKCHETPSGPTGEPGPPVGFEPPRSW